MLDDKTLRAHPVEWARTAIHAFRLHKADRIIAEANNGGDMVKHTIHSVDPDVPVDLVYAGRGKQLRAEPVSIFAERGELHHVGEFPALEDEQCTWEPGMKSPNHLDALVWGFTKLLVGRSGYFPIATVHVNGGGGEDLQQAIRYETRRDLEAPAALPLDDRVEHDEEWERRAAAEAASRARVARVLRQLGGQLPTMRQYAPRNPYDPYDL